MITNESHAPCLLDFGIGQRDQDSVIANSWRLAREKGKATSDVKRKGEEDGEEFSALC